MQPCMRPARSLAHQMWEPSAFHGNRKLRGCPSPDHVFICLILNLFWKPPFKCHGLWFSYTFFPMCLQPALYSSSTALITIFWSCPYTNLTSSPDDSSLRRWALTFSSCRQFTAWYMESIKVSAVFNWVSVPKTASNFREFVTVIR